MAGLLGLGVVLGLSQTGCAAMWVGAGAAGAATGYEVRNKYELDKLNRDYESGKLTTEEYEARKEQVEDGSVVY